MDVARAMQVFSQVATLGSFSRAAERLDLPAATVTHIVQELERELGTRLLHRTTRKVTLTDDGTLYLERCTRLLADIDLAILGAAPARFAEYESQIRAEYAHVPQALFAGKRRNILQGFLDREHIFQTLPCRDRFEAAARRNLAHAIAGGAA